MSPGHVAIIGFGAIAQDLVEILREAPEGPPDRVTVLVRPGREGTVPPGCEAVTDVEALLHKTPDVVVECAGHRAVAEHGPQILSAGIDLVVASVGVLADANLYKGLETAARNSGAQCVVPSGAIGGIDALGAARLSGLAHVHYVGRKPPQAWRGTPAEEVTDLGALTEPFVFFAGSAREAALAFPKNANVAATLALAGMGMDATQVQLIADPTTPQNVHEVQVASEALTFSVRLVGTPSPQNPKTSRSTVYSIARAVLNRRAAIAI